ncbi:unnamed protein product, partial [Polarella glacialis]
PSWKWPVSAAGICVALAATAQAEECAAGTCNLDAGEAEKGDAELELAKWVKSMAQQPTSSAEAEDELGRPDASRAAAFLDCEGLGEENSYWPLWRGHLAARTHQVGGAGRSDAADAGGGAVWRAHVYSVARNQPLEWHSCGDQAGRHDGRAASTAEGKLSSSFQRPSSLGSQRSCWLFGMPCGLCVRAVCHFHREQSERAGLPREDLKENWEPMMNSLGQILGVPSFVLDHFESANWGISYFDIAVNLNLDDGTYFSSYAEFCRLRPVPPPRLSTWRQDLPRLAAASEQPGAHALRDLCAPGDSGTIRVAFVGEHGPTNLDHLSTVSAALKGACGNSGSGSTSGPVGLEAAHFFTYLWALEGTEEGETLRASLRMTWEAFWGEPMTRSQGRASDSSPRWTVETAVQALRAWAWQEPFLRRARLVVCC